MKYTIYTVFIAIILSGCEMVQDYTYLWKCPEDVSSVEDINAIMERPEYNYVPDPIGEDVWNFPDETYNRTSIGNDCEDTAILYVYFHHIHLQDESVRLVALQDKENIDSYHMIYKVGDTYYRSDRTGRGRAYNYDLEAYWNIIFEYGYDRMLEAIYRKRGL